VGGVELAKTVLLTSRGFDMPIPTYDQMLRPLLELASRKPISRRTVTAEIGDFFGLSEEERNARVPSGSSTYLRNRVGWAMTFLTKGRLIEKVAPKQYAATKFGLEFLASHPNAITVRDLKGIDGWEEAWRSDRVKAREESEGADENRTPLEQIDEAVASIHSGVRSQLMDAILSQSPEFFEQLVLDVLVAMGYGGSKTDAALHLGKSGDEGIDGRINQDPLGLDQVLVQAKRNAHDNIIDRKSIQAFIGSLAGQGVAKGIFITTSSFAATAREFVQRGSSTKVVLIDGDHLVDLMMRHKIGVRVERSVELLDLDQNYFEDSE